MPAASAQIESVTRPSSAKRTPRNAIWKRRTGRVRVDELRQECKEEERRLRIQDVDDDALRERATEVLLASEGEVRLGAAREQGPQPERDEVDRTCDLDGSECDGRGDDQRGQAERRRRDVDERPHVDSHHRREPRSAPLVDRPGDDVDDRRPGDEQKRERGDDEETDGGSRPESPVQLPDEPKTFEGEEGIDALDGP